MIPLPYLLLTALEVGVAAVYAGLAAAGWRMHDGSTRCWAAAAAGGMAVLTAATIGVQHTVGVLPVWFLLSYDAATAAAAPYLIIVNVAAVRHCRK